MLTNRFKWILPDTVYDAASVGTQVFAALGSGLVVFDQHRPVESARTFAVAAESLVVSADGQTLLVVSPPLNAPPHFPLRRIDPPEQSTVMRQIWRLTSPFDAIATLGTAAAHSFSATFDGRYWGTIEGDRVYLFECTANGIELRARYDDFWPVRIEPTPQGVWVEESSLGASHYTHYSVPELTVIKSGDLTSCPLKFPPETICHYADGPGVAQPIYSVDSPYAPRIATRDGKVVAALKAPTRGISAAGERALFWVADEAGLEFLFICLRTARLKARFHMPGATQAGARIVGRDIAVWEGRTLRVYCDTADS